MKSLGMRLQRPALFTLTCQLNIYSVYANVCCNVKQNPFLKIYRTIIVYKVAEVVARRILFSFLILYQAITRSENKQKVNIGYRILNNCLPRSIDIIQIIIKVKGRMRRSTRQFRTNNYKSNFYVDWMTQSKTICLKDNISKTVCYICLLNQQAEISYFNFLVQQRIALVFQKKKIFKIANKMQNLGKKDSKNTLFLSVFSSLIKSNSCDSACK